MDEQIAERLQKLRKEHGYSQEQLADELGVSRQAVSKWERGEASPDTDNLIALARLYNISVDNLLFENSAEEVQKITPAEVESGSEENEQAKVKSKRRYRDIVGVVSGATVFVCCIVYFLLGGLSDLWHPAWIVFFAIPVTPTLAEAIIKKDANIFCFPVLVTAVYLLLGCQWGLWHPWWVVFFTIPIYYIIIDT